jgi:hypothetical protein
LKDEIRLWGKLGEAEEKLYYVNFSDKLRLAEVILGVRCPLPRGAIIRALGNLASHVKVLEAEVALGEFKVIEKVSWQE